MLQLKLKKKNDTLQFTNLDGLPISIDYDSVFGVLATWGVDSSISKNLKRTEFVKLWKENRLNTIGVISTDMLEPSNERRFSLTLESLKDELNPLRADGSKIIIMKVRKNVHRITTISKNGSTKKNLLTFLPEYSDSTGYPFSLSSIKENPEIAHFIQNTFDHLRVFISPDEAKRCATTFLTTYCNAGIGTQKGGLWYVDTRYLGEVKGLKKILDTTLANGLSLIPCHKTKEMKDYLKPIVLRQLERNFILGTKNINMVLSSSKKMGLATVHRYTGVIRSILEENKYFGERFEINTEVNHRAKKLLKQLERKM